VTLMKGAPRGLTIAIVALVAALCIAACGSSSSTATSSAASSGSSASAGGGGTGTTPGRGAFAADRTKLQACLKQHGISLPAFHRRSGASATAPGTGTTPGGGAPGFLGGGGGGAGGGGFARRFSNPKDAAAFEACAKQVGLGTGAGGFGGRFRPHFSATVLASFAACVKKNGYTLPKANTSGTGGIYPRSVETNPAFEKAAKSCESILQAAFRSTFHGGGPGSGGGPGGAGGPGSPPTSTTASS
jgi:hypothetical protein